MEQPEGSSLGNHPRFQAILKIGIVSWFKQIYQHMLLLKPVFSHNIVLQVIQKHGAMLMVPINSGLQWLILDGRLLLKHS